MSDLPELRFEPLTKPDKETVTTVVEVDVAPIVIFYLVLWGMMILAFWWLFW